MKAKREEARQSNSKYARQTSHSVRPAIAPEEKVVESRSGDSRPKQVSPADGTYFARGERDERGSMTAMATPLLLSRKANGVAVAQSSADAAKTPKMKTPVQGEKVVVRRLPPGMTEQEFLAILGEEWAVGHSKVDWFSYWPGKVSQQSVSLSSSF